MTSERRSILAELTPCLDLWEPPELTSPLVFSSPHSGRIYPRAFLESSRLSLASLRKSEDCLVDELFAGAVRLGAPLLAARFPRAYLDVNREPYELDPDLFEERLPEFANTRSLRVVGGLGTIARIVSDNEEIYRRRLTVAAALERIDSLYRPYHATLLQLLQRAKDRFGYAVLIDCHSMPSGGGWPQGMPRPGFVLGDRFGTSCSGALTRYLRQWLVGRGYETSLNRPYAGGYITEHYGRPLHRMHAIQIEVSRALYLDEQALTRREGFVQLARDVEAMVEALQAGLGQILERRLAAE